MIWGNNDSLGKTLQTQQAQQQAAQGISNAFQANGFFAWRANLYGSQTTQSQMLTVTYSQEQWHTWNTAVYIGDSIFQSDQYPGPPQNLWLYPNNYDSTGQRVWDYSIEMATRAGTHYFVFLWSCGSGNFIGARQTTQYGQAWGMPFCWTQRDGSSMSSDGYTLPWGSAAFIGFQYGSPNLDQKDANYPYGSTYSTFIQRFYYWSVIQHLSINRALDNAAREMSNDQSATLASLLLRQGYIIENLTCRIVVYGNGGMIIPNF